jgi:transposase
MLQNGPLPKVVVFLDNAAIHKNANAQAALRHLGVLTLFNAQYSPRLNPIEQLFRHVKAKLKTQGPPASK